jgi:hypothetical protein
VILGVPGNSNIDFLLILPCIWREMDNKGSGNRDTLYYRKHVTNYVSLNCHDAEGGKVYLLKLESSGVQQDGTRFMVGNELPTERCTTHITGKCPLPTM